MTASPARSKRFRHRSRAARLACWLLAALPVWFLFGYGGGLAPLYIFLAVAMLLGFADHLLASGRHSWITLLLGALLPLLPAGTAMSLPRTGWLGGLALGCALLAFLLDRVTAMLPERVARRAALLPMAAALGVVLLMLADALVPGPSQPTLAFWRHVGLDTLVMPASVPGEERIVLDTGAVAWFNRPHAVSPSPGVLFFHGAHRAGSSQAAAVIVRRALLDAGFAVLAVDHPGFGESPAPSGFALSDWDPQPTARAAFAVLTARDDVGSIYAIGHSMGTSEVLRLLGEHVQLAAVLILGGGIADRLDPHDDDSYWIRRFRTDRSLSNEAIDPEAIRAISKAHYDNAALADAVPRQGPPIHIGHFGVEWPNVEIAREQLNARLPENVTRHELRNVGHYFDGRSRAGIVLSSGYAYRQGVALFRKIKDLGAGT